MAQPIDGSGSAKHASRGSSHHCLGPYDLGGEVEGVLDTRIRNIGDTFIRIDREIADVDAKRLLRIFKIFPNAALMRFVAGKTFIVVSAADYDKLPVPQGQGFSPKMGIKILESTWYLRSDLFGPRRKMRIAQPVWYAAGSILAAELRGEQGFDRRRFQAEFNRYLTKRIGSVAVEPWTPVGYFITDPMYQIFFDKLVESKDFGREELRRLFREAKWEYENGRKPVRSKKRLLLARQNPLPVVEASKRMYEQFVDQGIEWEVDDDNFTNLSLQNASTRERVDSSHRLNFHWYNTDVNEWLGSVVSSATPGLKTNALLAPGLVGSYETNSPQGGKRAAILAGVLFDVDADAKEAKWTAHSYAGVPLSVRVNGREKNVNDEGGIVGPPEWELGLNYSNRIFMGAMMSVPFGGDARRYMGFVVRGAL